MQLNSDWHGEASAVGVVTMGPPVDFTRDREYDVKHLTLGAFPRKNTRARITGAATLAVQGCNGDPADENNWQTVAELTATGTVFTDEPWAHWRYNVTALTSGQVIIDLEAVNH
jgi:hypothetical protein